MKELNKMLGVEIKLLIAFHQQTDGQTEKTNKELEQYLRIYINYRQSNWLEWLATTEFAFNNKVYTAMKSSLFRVNYRRELKMGFEIRKKRKYTKAEKFVKEIKEMHKETKAVLKNLQEEMKKYVDKNRKNTVEYKVGNRVLLSTIDLMW